MIAISKLTFLYNYHPVLSEIPHLVSLWRTRRACCASDITMLPFSWQIIEYPVNLLFILGCETWNHPMGRSRENKAVSLRHTCGWRLHTNINSKTWWMLLKTGLIQNTTHGDPKQQLITSFTWVLKLDYFVLFRFQGGTFPCFPL